MGLFGKSENGLDWFGFGGVSPQNGPPDGYLGNGAYAPTAGQLALQSAAAAKERAARDNALINSQFRQYLGRDASDAELEQMRQYMNTGGVNLTAGDIADIVQSLPEYQNSKINDIGSEYAGNLTKYNQQILGQAADAAQAQFAQQGRQWSSGQGNAILQAGQQLAAQQSPLIADFYSGARMGVLGNQYALGSNQRAFGQSQQLGSQDWSRQLYANQVNYNNQLNANMQMAKTQNRLSQQSAMTMAPLTLASAYLGGSGGAMLTSNLFGSNNFGTVGTGQGNTSRYGPSANFY